MRLSIFGLICLAFIGSAEAASLAGQQIQPGGKIEIHFPVSKYFQDIASQAGNPRPTTGRAVIAFPAGFDPSRSLTADADQLTPPAGLLLVARLRGASVGCGALRLHGEAPADIKRMVGL